MTAVPGGDLAVAGLAIGLAVSLLLALVRIVRGPSLPDRIIAFDLVTVVAIATIGLAALVFEQAVLLDVAIVLALLTFIATVAFADHLIRREGEE